MDEVRLMQEVVGGDRPAFAKLVETHYDAIFRLLRHLTGSREDAEDLSQDVFLAVRTKGGRFNGTSSLRTWLTSIAVNASLKHRRRRRIAEVLHLVPRPVKQGSHIDSEWLLAGLAELTDEHRVALILFDVHGYSVREVAVITHCPEGTVKARLHYARKRLRSILCCSDEEAFNGK